MQRIHITLIANATHSAGVHHNWSHSFSRVNSALMTPPAATVNVLNIIALSSNMASICCHFIISDV